MFGGKLGFLPWQRPGFDLGLKLGEMADKHPEYVGVVLGGHGLFTWAETSKACYETTLRIIDQAADWLAANVKQPAFGGERVAAASPAKRREVAARLMPLIRGKISGGERKVGHFTDAPEVLEFVNSKALSQLAPLGTSCPDHFLRTKIRPAGAGLRSGRRQSRGGRRFARRDSSPPIAPTTPAIMSAASAPIRRRCAIPTP